MYQMLLDVMQGLCNRCGLVLTISSSEATDGQYAPNREYAGKMSLQSALNHLAF